MRNLRMIFPALVLAFGLAACSDSTDSSRGTGQLTLVLKDAPGEVLAAVVTISEINLQGSNGKTVLSTTPHTTNLLTLAADADSLLDGVNVPAGTYSQLRFVLSGAYIEVDNGDGTSSIYASDPGYAGLPAGATVTGALQMPSMGQSGLKVTLPGDALTITDGEEEILLVDFDVAQSFGHLAGNSGMWVMHPVITGGDIAVSGSATVDVTLDAAVTLPLVNNVQLTLADLQVSFTGSDGIPRLAALDDSDGDGTFRAFLLHVAPGNYDINLVLPAGLTTVTTTPALPATVTVTAGGMASTSLTVTAAS